MLRVGNIHSVLEAKTKIQSRGHLNGKSVLLDGQSIPAGRIWLGSPACDVGEFSQ